MLGDLTTSKMTVRRGSISIVHKESRMTTVRLFMKCTRHERARNELKKTINFTELNAFSRELRTIVLFLVHVDGGEVEGGKATDLT